MSNVSHAPDRFWVTGLGKFLDDHKNLQRVSVTELEVVSAELYEHTCKLHVEVCAERDRLRAFILDNTGCYCEEPPEGPGPCDFCAALEGSDDG